MNRLIIFVVAALFVTAFAAPAADLVTSLPGANFTIPFKHYSGYLKASDKKQFHYWFTEAYNNPASSPVLLWLNGGPGCSSLGGLIEELGPFHVSDNGNTVYENPYAWNRVGNVIFMESPAGVGFSYDTSGNVATNDDEVATNNYNALVDFFTTKFPEYKNNEFYITGESYGGVYVPTLAVKVAADKTNFPHFKGVAIGNGIYSFPLNYNTMVPLFYYHGLVRQNLYDKVATQCCKGNTYKCDYYTILNGFSECSTLVNELLDQGEDLDPYNLYSTCYLNGGSSSKRDFIRRMINHQSGLKLNKKAAGRASGLPLCAQSNNTETYLNRADVRAALHIPSNVGHWTDCSNEVGYFYERVHDDVSPEFKNLISNNLRLLTYNGDVDTVCNFALNKQFVAQLGQQLKPESFDSAEWYYRAETPSVAGFVTKYTGNLDFVTVRGSGHFVPEDKPREALQLIYNFIHQRDYSLPVPV
jgi:cathepsin A (carboxypeptidase C)|uniref:Carboxypeptidase n=1 Tax=Panagrolaimus sp. PS1159 TaxID=55785 RepID=A0AC35GG27_9BILA